MLEATQQESVVTWGDLSETMKSVCNKICKSDDTKEAVTHDNVHSSGETNGSMKFRDIFLQSRKPAQFKEIVKLHGKTIEEQISLECTEIENGLRSNRANPWRTLRRICGIYRDTLCIDTSSTNETLKVVRGFFSSIGNDDRGNASIVFDEARKSSIPINDEIFTTEELQNGVARLARNKAPGIYEIPAEVLSIMMEHSELRSTLLDLINNVCETGVATDSWKNVLQVPIPKKGDLSQISNWRPICLVNSVVKLMNSMILQRIRPSIEPVLRDSQYGFRPERSTAGAYCLTRQRLGHH